MRVHKPTNLFNIKYDEIFHTIYLSAVYDFYKK
jgi:hypothetical protein